MEQLSLIKLDKETVKPADFYITKANTLVEASYRLSLTQQRIIFLMISMVQPEDEDFKWYRLSAMDFMEIIDINNPKLYREMITAIHTLMERVITFFVGDRIIMKTHWINDALYRIGAGYVDVAFSPNLKPYLLQLKERFTTYKLENVMQLKSTYSIRIYELLKQYQGIGKRVITIENLRRMLDIKPGEYHLYGHFKSKVLTVAHREINEKTDICFDYMEIKLSRKVNELEFSIQQKVTQPKADKEAKQEKKERVQRKKEERKKTERKEKIEAYLGTLSWDELGNLKREAEELARKEGGAYYKDREIPQHVITGFLHELVEKRIGR